MAKHIIYGIGKMVLRDFRNPKTIIGFADLQDLSVESSFGKEDVTGGNKMFPIASFKKDQALKLSATNATFNQEMLTYMDGADKTVGAKTMTGFLEVRVPEGLTVTLPKTPIADSIVINGFTPVVTGTPTAKKFKADVLTKEIDFNVADVGKSIIIVYEYTGSATTAEYSVGQKSMAKPFSAEYIFDIYDDDSQVVAEAMIKIYKAQCSSGFSLDTKHQGPHTPKFEAEAKDAQRIDGKLWSFFIDGVEV